MIPSDNSLFGMKIGNDFTKGEFISSYVVNEIYSLVNFYSLVSVLYPKKDEDRVQFKIQ